MSQEVKDFQRATANRILHIYKNLGHRRVLLADEVGLGKTFVAKQVINLVREWHKQEKDDFFKVVYICSNANIADQNIEKLGVENRMSISESRCQCSIFISNWLRNGLQNSMSREKCPSQSFR